MGRCACKQDGASGDVRNSISLLFSNVRLTVPQDIKTMQLPTFLFLLIYYPNVHKILFFWDYHPVRNGQTGNFWCGLILKNGLVKSTYGNVAGRISYFIIYFCLLRQHLSSDVRLIAFFQQISVLKIFENDESCWFRFLLFFKIFRH